VRVSSFWFPGTLLGRYKLSALTSAFAPAAHKDAGTAASKVLSACAELAHSHKSVWALGTYWFTMARVMMGQSAKLSPVHTVVMFWSAQPWFTQHTLNMACWKSSMFWFAPDSLGLMSLGELM
jgi:hypothetical protein